MKVREIDLINRIGILNKKELIGEIIRRKMIFKKLIIITNIVLEFIGIDQLL